MSAAPGENTPGGAGPRVTRAQRAAVVIAMMGEAAAKPIVEKLDDAAMEQVNAALETVSLLPREDLVDIVMDFLQHLRGSSGGFRGGPDRAREIVSSLLDENRFGQIFGMPEQPVFEPVSMEQGDAWSQLEFRPPEQVAAYLNRLTPNIIALILRKLDVSVASEIVGHLEDGKLDPMIGTLVETGESDPEIDAVLSRMIEMEFLNNQTDAGEEDESHLEAVGELLSLIPSDKRDRLVAFLNETHESKMRSIEKVLFTIDGLPDMLDRASVPVVFRELGDEPMVQLLAALRGEGDTVSEYLLGNISSRLADQYRLQLEDIGEMTPEDAETLQRQFLTSLMSLKRQGLITMEKPAPKEEAEA